MSKVHEYDIRNIRTEPFLYIFVFHIMYIQGGPAKARQTYIFDGNIWIHRWNSMNVGKCDNSNLGTHLEKHKSLIFNIVHQG